jgi:hypothetical protein
LFIFFLASVVTASTPSCGSVVVKGGVSVYVAQVPAGTRSGGDCSNARAFSDLIQADWLPGNTIHLCGTITVPAGSAGLVAQGSGTASNPIVVKFETNAILESPYFPYQAVGPCNSLSTCAAGIELYGYNYASDRMNSSYWLPCFPTLSPEKRRKDGARNWYKFNRSET